MGLQDWLREFRELHERARTGLLSHAEQGTYERSREKLARMLLASQRLNLDPGQLARRYVRVPVSIPVEIADRGVKQEAVTLNLSVGGFAATLNRPPQLERVEVILHIPNESAPLEMVAQVRGTKSYGMAFCAFYSFEAPPESATARLSFLVFDAVLDSLGIPSAARTEPRDSPQMSIGVIKR